MSEHKNNKKLEEFIAGTCREIEAKLREYFSLPLFEQIEKVKTEIADEQEYLDKHSPSKRKKKNPQLKVVGILEKIKRDLIADADEEIPPNYYEVIDEKIKVLIHSQVISGMFEAYLRYMFVTALIGNGTHVLNLEYRQKLKAEFDLIQPSNFKDALSEILNPIFLLPSEDEDLARFWTNNRCLELLAKYNRLSIIIKNVRKELKKNRNLKKELQEKYGVSGYWIDLIDSIQYVKDLALEWSLEIMNIEIAMQEFNSLRKSQKVEKDKSELSYEHIRNRILTRARNICPVKNTLVYCTFYGQGRQLGSVPRNSELEKLLKVEDWSKKEAFGQSIFFAQMNI